MSDILNENKADKQVIKSLLREIKILKERLQMSKILFDAEGKVYRATDYYEVTDEDLNRELEKAQGEVNELTKVLHRNDTSAPVEAANQVTPESPATPEVPTEPTPAVAQPEVPAAVTPAPEAQPTTETPVIDPATAPAPVAPIVLN